MRDILQTEDLAPVLPCECIIRWPRSWVCAACARPRVRALHVGTLRERSGRTCVGVVRCM